MKIEQAALPHPDRHNAIQPRSSIVFRNFTRYRDVGGYQTILTMIFVVESLP